MYTGYTESEERIQARKERITAKPKSAGKVLANLARILELSPKPIDEATRNAMQQVKRARQTIRRGQWETALEAVTLFVILQAGVLTALIGFSALLRALGW